MGKLLVREIRHSLSRFLAIMAIIALGVGFFCGLRVTRTAMVQTGEEYLTQLHFYDFRLLSTLGLTDEDVAAFSRAQGVAYAEGSVNTDVLVSDANGTDNVMRLLSMPQQVNLPHLVSGRLPQAADECVVDSQYISADGIGTQLQISDTNDESTRELFATDSFTIVGIVDSPVYLNYERGNTSLANGAVSGFAYIPLDALKHEVFTEINVRMDEQAALYSDDAQAIADRYEPQLSDLLETRATLRFDTLKADGQQALDTAKRDLDDAVQQLSDARTELENGERKYENGCSELAQRKQDYQDGIFAVQSGRKQLAAAKTKLSEAWQSLADTKATLAAQRQTLDEQAAALESAQASLDGQFAALEGADETDPAVQEALGQLKATQAALDTQKQMLKDAQATYDAAVTKISETEAMLTAQQATLTQTERELNASATAFAEAQTQIAEAEGTLADSRKTLDDGWVELEENRTKLADAKKTIAEKQAELDEIDNPTCYTLGRDTNTGYVCFESDTDIVRGIANVFPLFFFLVAALVCITTMTRMVEEQRTQIGTLKALGYSDNAIMGNYLLYASSASVIGCVTGFLLGSWAFPKVLWIVYDMMYNFDRPIDYVLDGRLALLSIVLYLVCALLATWSACKTSLREVAAQLIRPKAPAPGKRIVLERIPFIWKHLSFLHKVSARNVFRYRKRLIMMVLGIGGCMSLLLTGFGLNDSIRDIVSYQFDDISVYDYEIGFRDAMDDDAQAEFGAAQKDALCGCVFVQHSTVDVEHGSAEKSAHLVAAEENVTDYVNLFDKQGNPVVYPKDGEVIINTRLAEEIGASVGDTITVYDSDHNEMTATVAGCYVNYIYNIAYLTPATYESGFDHAPQMRTAYANVQPGADLHEVAGSLMKADNVGTVSINQDLADRVGSILDNLNYIVVLVIACAAALAFIVLYNLTNININERIREIATLKVLGFYARETSAYVFRENVILTAMGTVFGIPLGFLLHRFVMSQIRIDMITFPVKILWSSILLSVALCFVFALIVDLFMRGRIRRIDMAESLKAAE